MSLASKPGWTILTEESDLGRPEIQPWGKKFQTYVRRNGHVSGACIVCGRPTSDNAKWVAASPADGTFHPASDIEALAQTQPELEVSAYQIGANCFAKHRAQLSICEVK